jgi:CBS domain-containing protein
MNQPSLSFSQGDPRSGVLLPVLEFLRRHAPFDRMDPQHLVFLAGRLKLTFYARGEEITDPGGGPASRLYIIQRGRVRGEMPGAGGEGSGSAWELVPGECFPVGALLSQRPVRAVHRAAADTFCFELDGEDFRRLLRLSAAFHDFCTRRMASLLDQMHRQVQASAATGTGQDTSLDVTLGTCLRREPVTCLATTPIREALQAMERENVGSVAVVDGDALPLGMFTLHDLLSRVALAGRSLEEEIGAVMTPEPLTLPPSAFAFEAALLMADRGVRHVCVAEGGRLKGVISERDLFSLQRVGLVHLSRSVARADAIPALARLVPDMLQLITQMIAQGAQVEQVTQIITLLTDRVTRRVIELGRREFRDAPPPFTWLAFGSEGRKEQTLKVDQDNGILFAVPRGGSPAAVRESLLPLARAVNEGLHRCGYPLCAAGIMGGNPHYCLSADEWRERFAGWMEEGSAEGLGLAGIFFDLRAIEGPTGPADELRRWLLERTRGDFGFLRRMAAQALRERPPLGLVRGSASADEAAAPVTVDLKAQGLTPFVDGVRVLALAHGIDEVATLERIGALARGGHVAPEEAEVWARAFSYVQLLRVRHQRAEIARGLRPGNRIALDVLNELDRRILKEAFRQARKLQARIAREFSV